MRVRTCLLAIVVAASMCLTSVASADVMAVSNVDRNTGVSPTANNFMLGWSFTPTQDVKVTALGVFDRDNNNVLAGDTDVKIWRQSDATLITSAAVTTSAPISGEFFWATLATQDQATLQANTTYVIACRTYPGSERYMYNSSATMASEITYVTTEGQSGTDWTNMPADPVQQGWVMGFFGPNFKYEVVPEPMTMSLLSLGGLAMLARRRRK